MDNVIELYSKIIVATLTFVAPLFSIFLSIYKKGLSDKEKQISLEKELIDNQFRKKLSEGEDISREMKRYQAGVTELERKKSQIDQSKPAFIIRLIFLSLFTSLICLSFAHLNREGIHIRYKHDNSILFLVLSGGFYSLAVYQLSRILRLIIEFKEKEEQK